MIKKLLFLSVSCLLLTSALVPLNAYYVTYKEQYYRLYHLHYIQYPDDTMENIYWLEKALKADFCNPLYALALIENETQYEKYRYLFNMHLNLKMIEQGQGVKGIAKISLHCLFQPVDIFHGVIGVLDLVQMVKAVVLFLIGDKITVKRDN